MIRAVSFLHSGEPALAGIPLALLPALGPRLGPGPTALAQALYIYAYCAGAAHAPLPALPGANPDRDFLAALNAANAGRDHWDRGWRIIGVGPSGEAMLQKENVSHAAWPGEYWTNAAPGTAPRVGMAARLFCLAGSTDVHPGFWFAFGETPSDTVADARRVRIYWHIQPAAAAQLVNLLTHALNRFQLPFQLKCLATPVHFWRRNSLVLYLSRRHYTVAHTVLSSTYAAVATSLDPEVPAFTLGLAPGVALAEDPSGAESFGQTRCRLVAEGLYAARARGATDEDDKLAAVYEAFATAGVDPRHPYRNPGSSRDYATLDVRSL